MFFVDLKIFRNRGRLKNMFFLLLATFVCNYVGARAFAVFVAVVDYRAASSIAMATAYAEFDDLASSRYLVAEQIIKLLRDEHQTDECRCSPR